MTHQNGDITTLPSNQPNTKLITVEDLREATFKLYKESLEVEQVKDDNERFNTSTKSI